MRAASQLLIASIAILVAASALACGATDVEVPANDTHASNSTALGDKADAAFISDDDYFRQFVYAADEAGGRWEDGAPQWVYYLSTSDHHPIGGSNDWFGLDVYLMADGTAWVRYAEWTRVGGGQSDLVAEAILRTDWQVAESQLVLRGVGAARRASRGGQAAMDLTLSTNFTSPGVSGQSVTLVRTHGTYRVELIERDYAAQ